MSNAEMIRFFFDFLMVPILIGVWNVQGRVSKIEGQLNVILSETDRRKNPR
ncbi:MAG TPA: hypothetical protein VMW50_14685 [Dehalococcoidia bacterium]|nr:hypothetical protein [Dehalococcoidia bacterium]